MATYNISTIYSFIRSIYPQAEAISNQSGIPVSLILAQVALETGWGTKIIPGSNNLFNIKADSSWTGPTVTVTTTEYKDGVPTTVEAKFRAYNSYEESFNDWIDFLQDNPRYDGVFDPNIKGDLEKIAQALEDAGYATDPNYAEKLIATANGRTMGLVHFFLNFDYSIDPSFNRYFTRATQWVWPSREPLTLDLDGDGIETVGINTNNPILFDHDADGVKTATGWVKPDDGLLVLDRNGNGVIDNGRELFGDSTQLSSGGNATDGFAALADLDNNADGQIDANDAQFNNLRVWRDLNQDGISQANELSTLEQQNIASISLTTTQNNQLQPDGNRILDLGTYTKTDGTTGTTGATGRKLLAVSF